MTTAWVVLPTYDERENLDDRRRARPSRARELRPAGQRHRADRRRRLAGRHRRARRPARRRARRRPRPPPRAKEGLGGAYLAGFDEALATAPTS